LANCQNLLKLEDIRIELDEIYGLAPIEVLNFYSILEARVLLNHLPLKSIKVLKKQIILSFDQLLVESNSQLREKIVSYFISRPKVYKMKPNFTITCIFKSDISIDTFVDFAKHIAVQIEAC
jgi:transcription-repair coupling factor (superfamily II helicase)